MFLIKALSEHFIHEEVNLVDGMKFSQIGPVGLLLESAHVSELGVADISVFDNFVKCALFPSVFNAPVEFLVRPLLHFFFVVSAERIIPVLPIFALLTLEVFPFRSLCTRCEEISWHLRQELA